MSYTKGEWQARDHLIEAPTVVIAVCCSHTKKGSISNEETLANAKLIAAAPDLLQALQILLSGLKKNIDMYSVTEKISIAEEAIKKAIT